ncbi:MAG TPA: c-type cytochrome [Smithella sp.]|nr:c-type cytochrome [Smithella sp.]
MKKTEYLRSAIAVAAGLGFFLICFIPCHIHNALADERPDGAKLYTTKCGVCHPNGGNIIDKKLPLVGSRHMKTLEAFVKYNRQPLKADGSKGVMPAFTKEQISDQDMAIIYEYAKKLTKTGK